MWYSPIPFDIASGQKQEKRERKAIYAECFTITLNAQRIEKRHNGGKAMRPLKCHRLIRMSPLHCEAKRLKNTALERIDPAVPSSPIESGDYVLQGFDRLSYIDDRTFETGREWCVGGCPDGI